MVRDRCPPRSRAGRRPSSADMPQSSLLPTCAPMRDMQALPPWLWPMRCSPPCFSAITALLMVGHARNTGRRGYLLIGGTFAHLVGGVLVFLPLYFPGAVFPAQHLGRPSERNEPLLRVAFRVPDRHRGLGRPHLRRSAQPSESRAVPGPAGWPRGHRLGVVFTLLLATFGSGSLPAVLGRDGSKTPTPWHSTWCSS